MPTHNVSDPLSASSSPASTGAVSPAAIPLDGTIAAPPPEATPERPHADPEAGPDGGPDGGSVASRGWPYRLARALGIDRAIAFTVLARGWSSLAGIGTLTLIARFLTPAEQGFYYTFYSLVAMQIVFELGFSVVILQTASHEAAHLEIAPDGRIQGPEAAHARLASVLQKSVRWYTVAAVLMAAVLLPVGIHFFRANTGAPGAAAVHWIAALVRGGAGYGMHLPD